VRRKQAVFTRGESPTVCGTKRAVFSFGEAEPGSFSAGANLVNKLGSVDILDAGRFR